jgi:hypothetical protein
MKSVFLIIALLFCSTQSIIAQIVSKKNAQTNWAIKWHSGNIVVHTPFVESTRGAKPQMIEAEWGKLNTDSSFWQLYHSYIRTGIAISYVNFKTPVLEKGLNISYFAEPNFILAKGLNLTLRAAFGCSYLTKPFDTINHTSNKSYGSHINFYTQVGGGINYAIGNHLRICIAGNFNHNSNGGAKLPNRGVNYTSLSIGAIYFPQTTQIPRYKRIKNTSWKQQKPWLELTVFGAVKQGNTAPSVTKPRAVTGLQFTFYKKISPINALSISAEIYHDDAIRTSTKTIGDSISSPWVAGIMAGHAFLFGRLSFTQQLGIYLYKNLDEYERLYLFQLQNLSSIPFWYHRWGINYQCTEHLGIGFNFKANKAVADFFDFRLSYRFGRKSKSL